MNALPRIAQLVNGKARTGTLASGLVFLRPDPSVLASPDSVRSRCSVGPGGRGPGVFRSHAPWFPSLFPPPSSCALGQVTTFPLQFPPL